MSKDAKSIGEQVALLMQGTEYGDETLHRAMESELKDRLATAQSEGRPLRVYCGFDPRTSDLHIGHMVPIRKMRQFQELGHEVIFLIGRFTSLVGDPSDKDKVRAQITLEQATKNAETYAEQAYKILDADKTRLEYNDTWLSELTFADLIHIASNFTVQQFLTRETFRKRFDSEDPIYLHEFFYALMQAYDAYHMKTDVQIGGTDQLFNIITAGRKLMEALGEEPNIGVILGILPGTDGKLKMSKSLGNHIPLESTPADMFGKVMSVPDKAMADYARLATRWSPPEILKAEDALKSGELHPRDLKMRLAHEIVAIYHGEDLAASAQADFERVFQKHGEPADIEVFTVPGGATYMEIMMKNEMASSKSEARRLAKQNGVRLNDQIVPNLDIEAKFDDDAVLRVGKRRFLKLRHS